MAINIVIRNRGVRHDIRLHPFLRPIQLIDRTMMRDNYSTLNKNPREIRTLLLLLEMKEQKLDRSMMMIEQNEKEREKKKMKRYSTENSTLFF